MRDLEQATDDMRRGYQSGAAGILASSLVWGAAAAIAILVSPERSVWVLFIGGMMIFPVGVLISKLTGARGAHSKGNPLASLAMASTFWMIFSLPLVYVAGLQAMQWFFPAMLLVIGGRYLTFATLYGMKIFWALGLALAFAGLALGYLGAQPAISAAAGAGLEFAFAIVVFVLHARWLKTTSAAA